jgi:Helicase conserved C-terminal domain
MTPTNTPEPDEDRLAALRDEDEDDRDATVTYLQHRTPGDLQWECLQLRGLRRTLDDLSGPASKMTELLRTLDQRRIRDTGRSLQTVIFTRFYDTLCDLVSRLQRVAPEALIGTYSGRGGQYWDATTGRMVGVERDEIKHRFLRGEIDILICTDAAAEGLNLQTADLLVNFDLPWNPMKVEQRIGRIDRIGQRHQDIYVLNLCYADSAVAARLCEDDVEPLRQHLSAIARQEFAMTQAVPRIEALNERAGHSQRLLDYLVASGLLQSRLQTGSDEALFGREVQALEAICQGRDSLRVRHIPPALGRRLSGVLFDLDLPSMGDEGFVDAPQPLIQASLDAMCRLANGLKRRRADLATADVISRVEREIERLGS